MEELEKMLEEKSKTKENLHKGSNFQNVLIFLKPNIEPGKVEKVVDILIQKGKRVFLTERINEKIQKFGYLPVAQNLKEIDIIFVLGGDGAILRTCEKLIEERKLSIPVVGINMGRVGFLTFGEEPPEEVIEQVIKGEYKTEEINVLTCSVGKEKETRREKKEFFAVNDFLVKSPNGILEFEIFCEDDFIGKIRADGVLISSQIGSTAYNLSLGGPIVYSGTEVILISFLAPFSLFSRSVILPKNKSVYLKSSGEAVIYADGKKKVSLEKKKEVAEFRYSDLKIKILKGKKTKFFDSLREKFKWLL
jgi:NAD+ kinase